MKKMNSSTKQLILLIFNSVLTIATFVITYYIDPLKYTSQSSLAAVPAFLLSIIVLIIGQNITITIPSKEKTLHPVDIVL